MIGWKLVPVEPTKEMSDAVTDYFTLPAVLYQEMLAAAPSPPEELVEEIARTMCFTNRPVECDDLGCTIKSCKYGVQDYEDKARAVIAKLGGKP
jgi:hypothetical protein